MKIEAPDGTIYEFPDDAQDAEIEEFVNSQAISRGIEQTTQAAWTPMNIITAPGVGEASQMGQEQAESQRQERLMKSDPYGQMRAAEGYRPMGPFGPLEPQELLSIPETLQIPGAVLESATEPLRDMAIDWLRRTGLDPSAEPGRNIIDIERIPNLSPGGVALRIAAPGVALGLEKGAGKVLSGFTEPGMAATLPLAAGFKPIQALFGASMAGAIPESLANVTRAKTPEELGIASAGAAANIGMTYAVGRHLLPRARAEAFRTKGVSDASKIREAKTLYGNVRPPPIPGAGKVPAEARGPGVQPQAQGVAQEAQVLLSKAIQENQRLGLGHEVEILDSFGQADPQNLRVFRAEPAVVDEAGNFVRPGKIAMSQAAFNLWKQSIDPARLPEVFQRTLVEEGLHSITTPAEALAYSKTLTAAEIAAGRKLYLGEVTAAEAGLNDTLLGHELLRQRMQRIMEMEPTELAEVAGREKWSRASLEFIASMIRGFREFVGTIAAKAGGMITDTLLDRAEANVKRAMEAIPDDTGVYPEQAAVSAEQPFSIRRMSREDPKTIIGEVNLMTPDDFIGFSKQSGGLTESAYELGRSLKSPDDLMAMQAARTMASEAVQKALAEKDYEALGGLTGKVQFYSEAIGAATGSGSAGAYLRKADPNYRPPFPEAADEFPAGLRRKMMERFPRLFGHGPEVSKPLPKAPPIEVAEVDETGITRKQWERGIKEFQDAEFRIPSFKQVDQYVTESLRDLIENNPFIGKLLEAKKIGIDRAVEKAVSEVKIYHDSPTDLLRAIDKADPDILETYRYMALDYESKAKAKLYQNLMEEHSLDASEVGAILNDYRNEGRQRLYGLSPGLGRLTDLALFPNVTEWRQFTAAPSEKIPAAIRRKRPQDEPELPLGATKGKGVLSQPEREPATEALAKREAARYEPVTAAGLEAAASKHLSETKGPSFKAFVKEARARFGDLKHGQLFDMWEASVGKKLLAASGEELKRIVSDLGMAKKLSAEGQISDPVEAQRYTERTEAGELPFDFQARRPYGTPPSEFTPAQRKRYRIMGALYERLVGQSEVEGGRKFLARKEIDAEDIADPRMEPKEPIYQQFTTADHGDLVNLGRVITEDAQTMGFEKSATKRLSAIQDRRTGKVYQVSTYRDGRRGPVIKHPNEPGKRGTYHAPIEDIARRFRLIDSVLLDDPVQNFKREFKNLAEYEADFGAPARAAAQKAMGYKPPLVEGEAIVPRRTIPPEAVTDAEAASIIDQVLAEVGSVKSAQDVKLAWEALKDDPSNRQVFSGLRKLGRELLRREPNLSEEQFLDKLSQQVYENHVKAKDPADFQRLTMEQSRPPAGEAAGLETAPGTAAEGAQPASLRRAVNASAKLTDKTLVEGFRLYSEWMSERIARVGGPKAKAFSDAVNVMITRERELYGGLTPVLDPARKAAGKFSAATSWLKGLREVTPESAISRAVGAIEGTIMVPPRFQALVDLGKAANLEIGRLYQRANPSFQATGKFQRNPTSFGYDLIREGTGDAWQKWIQGNAVANRMSVADVEAFFKKWKKVLDDPGVDDAAIERVNQDFQRKFPKAITHIKHAGQWQQVIHADLFNYLETAARRATHVAAFREFFPNTAPARRAFSNLMDDVRAETPGTYHGDVVALMRALQGHPTDNYSALPMVRPGQPIGEAFRFVNQTVGNLFSKMVLTGQMFVQPGENIAGSTPVFLGYKNYLRGLARIRELYPQLETQGAVNRVIMDFSFDPHSPVRSVSRIAGNVMSKTFAEQFLNELQEASAAATAKVTSERIRAGNLSRWERSMLPRTFKAMGFNPAQVSEIMRGNPDLLAQFESKAASFLTSGNKALAEGSRLGANRLFNSVFRFQSYPMMKANQLRKVLGGTIDAWKTGTGAERTAATYLLARFLFGAAAQGAITTGLTALFYEGVSGAKIRSQEAQDEPLNFLAEATAASMSGPLYFMWRGSRDKGLAGVGEQASRLIFPFQVIKELWNYAWGQGAYRDLNWFDRSGKFIRQKIPGSRAISQGLALAGLSQDNKELDASINAFYRWRRQTIGFSEFQPFLKDDERKAFRSAMRRAMEAMKDGNDAAYDKAIDEAYDLGGKKGVQASMRARTILKGPDGKKLSEEQLDALRKHIGDRPVDLLEDFDAMVEATAKAP